ncbi:MAG: glycosyltransferase [Propionibacteriaceae bacterium]|jgi:poly(glycerol-phosphate) alpha-glucosyltransferase|nr:glycosyltransferase [Propionibacteriaceae bacterium]
MSSDSSLPARLRKLAKKASKTDTVPDIPTRKPFPTRRYLFLTRNLSLQSGGVVRSLLTKTKLLAAEGVPCEIYTTDFAPDLAVVVAGLRADGRLAEGVQVAWLFEHLAQGGQTPGEPVVHGVDEPGLSSLQTSDPNDYRLFEHGVYRLYKSFTSDGRLRFADHFNDNRFRTQTDEYGADGRLIRRIWYDYESGASRQEVYYRPDGTAYLARWMTAGADGAHVQRSIRFDADEQAVRAVIGEDAAVHEALDEIIGEDRAFLSVEAWRPAGYLPFLGYRRPNVKTVFTVHGNHLEPGSSNPAQVGERFKALFERHDDADAVVLLTNAQRADVESVYGVEPPFDVIPSVAAVAPDDESVVRDDNLVVMLTRLVPSKQVEQAVKAFRKVVKAVPSARLEIFGYGSRERREKLQALIDHYGLAESVRLAGYTSNPEAEFRRASVSLLTSRDGYEGLPQSVLESLANGCPVVAYDVKYGPADVIRDGENGLLVPSGDTKALAQGVARLLGDEELARRCGKAGRKAMELYSPEVYVTRWSDLFARLDQAS